MLHRRVVGCEDSSVAPVAAGVISLLVSLRPAKEKPGWQSTWPARYGPRGLGCSDAGMGEKDQALLDFSSVGKQAALCHAMTDESTVSWSDSFIERYGLFCFLLEI